MAQAKGGDTVRVHYVGTLDDGTQFDSSRDRKSPFEFQIGAGMVIEGFDKGVTGMNIGETKTIKMSVGEAYGPRNKDLITGIPKAHLPPDIKPELGAMLQVPVQGGQIIEVRIVDITDNEIVVDANHPLAGESLTFELELLEIL